MRNLSEISENLKNLKILDKNTWKVAPEEVNTQCGQLLSSREILFHLSQPKLTNLRFGV